MAFFMCNAFQFCVSAEGPHPYVQHGDCDVGVCQSYLSEDGRALFVRLSVHEACSLSLTVD